MQGGGEPEAGDRVGVVVVIRSASHSESNRSSSMATTASASAPGSVSPSMPRLTPMRTFTSGRVSTTMRPNASLACMTR